MLGEICGGFVGIQHLLWGSVEAGNAKGIVFNDK